VRTVVRKVFEAKLGLQIQIEAVKTEVLYLKERGQENEGNRKEHYEVNHKDTISWLC
jgi:hypothetical protein